MMVYIVSVCVCVCVCTTCQSSLSPSLPFLPACLLPSPSFPPSPPFLPSCSPQWIDRDIGSQQKMPLFKPHNDHALKQHYLIAACKQTQLHSQQTLQPLSSPSLPPLSSSSSSSSLIELLYYHHCY